MAYFDHKTGSLEDAILGLKEEKGDKEKYTKFFNDTLKRFGVKSPAELDTAKKKEFFNYIDKNYIGDHEVDNPKAESRDPSKSGTGYDISHKDFSSAMQHAYDFAKRKYGITIDPSEIDKKVATGPRKPSEGKTNRYRLKGRGGNIQIQVHNKGGSKPFELNMYKEEVDLDEDIMPLIFGGGIAAALLPVLFMSVREIIRGTPLESSIKKIVDKLKKNKNYKMSDSEKSDVKGFVSKVKKDKPSLLQKAMKNIKEEVDEVDLDENTWQVVRNYADGKFSPSPMQGFRTEKEAQKRAAELNKKEKTKDTFSVRYNTMKFRGESYDIGTDEYSKHTMDTTPGQNNEDYLKQLHGKNYSMREALAKVWNVDEGKSPFEPEKKIKLSDAMKDGKTDTGKKMTKVTVSENKEAEKIIIDTLKKEGGAAGMSALEKAVKDKGIDVDVKDLVSKMSNVKTHEHGDIILEGRMGELSAAAKDIEKSAKKMSGQDKQELMTIVGMIKRTELSNLAKEIKSQDTEIRELILDKMLDNMSKSDVERALGIKFGRSGFVSDFDIK